MSAYANNLILGFSMPFLLWGGAIATAWACVLYRNRGQYRDVLNLPRAERLQLAAWLYMFDVSTGIMWQRGASFLSIWNEVWSSVGFQYSILVYLLYVVPGLALGMWWSLDRAQGAEAGDRCFWRLIWWGIGLGAVVFAGSIYLGK